MKGIFSIMSHPNTSWMFIDCNKVWYVINTMKSLAAIIYHQGSYYQRYF